MICLAYYEHVDPKTNEVSDEGVCFYNTIAKEGTTYRSLNDYFDPSFTKEMFLKYCKEVLVLKDNVSIEVDNPDFDEDDADTEESRYIEKNIDEHLYVVPANLAVKLTKKFTNDGYNTLFEHYTYSFNHKSRELRFFKSIGIDMHRLSLCSNNSEMREHIVNLGLGDRHD